MLSINCDRVVRKMTETTLQSTKISVEGGRGGIPATWARKPLQPLRKTLMKQVVPLQLMVYRVGADISTVDHGRPHTRTVIYVTWWNLQPMESPYRRRFLSGTDVLCSCQEPTYWRSPFLKHWTLERIYRAWEEGTAREDVFSLLLFLTHLWWY